MCVTDGEARRQATHSAAVTRTGSWLNAASSAGAGELVLEIRQFLGIQERIDKYGLTLVLSYAQRENLNLLRCILTWPKGHMRALSPDGAPPEEFSTGCFASHLPHARMLAELGFTPSQEGSLFVNARSMLPRLV
jgi:hypothetical protein